MQALDAVRNESSGCVRVSCQDDINIYGLCFCVWFQSQQGGRSQGRPVKTRCKK
uniref:Uncharacterized protein n=1 Tax=Aegilops tauschii subsp. strangulata TaxID=200361 RepID=A0A452ZTS7_AEGTS